MPKTITDQSGASLSIGDLLSASLLTKPRQGYPDYIIEHPYQSFTAVTLPAALKADLAKPANKRRYDWPYRPPCYLLTVATFSRLTKDERFVNTPGDPFSIGNQLAGLTMLHLTDEELQCWLATLILRIQQH